jgi:hypothetical protein
MSQDKPHVQVPTRGKAPVFVNGLTTHNTYLVIGVRNGEEDYNAVGVRRVGSDEYKLHFWPNAATFGIKDGDLGLNLYARGQKGESNGPYQGAVCNTETLGELLETLATFEGTSVAPKDKVQETLAQGFSSKRHFTA